MKQAYKKAVNAYRKSFEKKHNLTFEYWVNDEVGTIAGFNNGMYYIDFRDMKLDIDNDVEKNKFFEWYDYTLEEHYRKQPIINYKTFLKIN